jgi:hypothetical protein
VFSLRLASLLLAATFTLGATSCQELCDKFGDAQGCRRLQAGERDCSYPPARAHRPATRQTPSAAPKQPTRPAEKIERFATRWEGGREKRRFLITLSRKRLTLEGQSVPPLDPYYLRFSPKRIEGDHLIEIESPCRPGAQGRFLCNEDRTENYRQVTVLFKKTGPRAFDFKLFALPRGAVKPTPQTLQFRAFSDGKRLTLEYYRGGYLLPRLTERHPLAP